MKTGITMALLCATLLAGCATHYEPTAFDKSFDEAIAKRNAAPVYPASASATVPCGSNCAALMQRAQAWIATHADYKIQTSSATLVQTFGPITDRIGEAFTVTLADGVITVKGAYAGTGQCNWSARRPLGACFDPAPAVQQLVAELQRQP